MTVWLTTSSFSTQISPEKVGSLKGMRVQATPVVTWPLPKEKTVETSPIKDDPNALMRRIFNLARHLGDPDDLDFVASMTGDTRRRQAIFPSKRLEQVVLHDQPPAVSHPDAYIIFDFKADFTLMQRIHDHMQALKADGRDVEIINPF